MSKKDYYQILNIAKNASKEDVKRSYKKLAIENHPDRHKEQKEVYEKKFKDIAEAYSILSDDQKRAYYDRTGENFENNNGFGGGHQDFGFDGFDVKDIFESFFGDRGGSHDSRPRAFAERGADLKYGLKMTLEEILKDTKKTVSFSSLSSCQKCSGFGAKSGKQDTMNCSRCKGSGKLNIQQGFFFIQQACNYCQGAGFTIKDPCGDCGGEGRVNKKREFEVIVPKGADDGMFIKQEKMGEAGIRGGKQGDLFLKIQIEDHKIFKRDAKNLILDVPITFTQAILGDKIEILTISKEKVACIIPKHSKHGSSIRMAGHGLPYYNTSRRGDLIINLHIETPRKVTKEQEDLLTKLHNSFTDDNHPERESFLDTIKKFFS